MTKKQIRQYAFNFLGHFDIKIKTKLNNICGKTGQYNVPSELFQKRTHRKNRVLISWKTVKRNNLTMGQLETFTGGVVVEFVNEDFFEIENQKDALFIELKNRLGSDELVSSMISIRNEDGSSSSILPRQSFKKLKDIFPNYKNNIICRKENNSSNTGMGNEMWQGFIYISIRGGQQDIEMTHTENVKYQLFNPACEFANESVCLDIDLVMSYFALNSIDYNLLNQDDQRKFSRIKSEIETTLKRCEYDNAHFKGNLFDYCTNHPCLKMTKGKLYDPIQVKEIYIQDFAIDRKDDDRNIDFTHDEAVNKDRYYWDKINNCILTPSRPTNVFWSKHLSNMMQQNFSLDEYFIYEEKIVERRKGLLEKK